MTQNNEASHYYDLKTEFGFKRVISLEPTLKRFQEFANAIFEGRTLFSDIQYIPNVISNVFELGDMTKFDVLCRVTPRTMICTEMAQYREEDFNVRTRDRFSALISKKKSSEIINSYDSFIYINILNFTVWPDRPNYIHFNQMRYSDTEELAKKRFLEVSIELSKFNKNLNDLTTELDKWLYLFRYMQDLKTVPEIYNTAFFRNLFQAAKRY